jgi:hypothetical protein
MRWAVAILSFLLVAVTLPFVWTVAQTGLAPTDEHLCELARVWVSSVWSLPTAGCAAHRWILYFWAVGIAAVVAYLIIARWLSRKRPVSLTAPPLKLRRESNARFGFSFAYPSLWDRQDPTNGDGNAYRHPIDPRISLSAWGQYAVVSPDLNSWVDWTIKYLQTEPTFRLLTRVPAGSHLVDWNRSGAEPTKSSQQIEGIRIVYTIAEGGQPFTASQTFIQYGNTQVGLCCRSPSASYANYEDLFLVISKKLRLLGPNSAPFARGVER